MDELLDIVNDEDIVTGQEMRSTIHQLGLQHRGVHVFLFTHDGMLLIQKRSKDRAAFPSAWDCSVSEHVQAGESYYDAAMRGMREEMGLTEIKIQPIVKFKMNYGPNDNEISTIYRGIIDAANVRFDPVEIEEIEYLRLEELQKTMNESDKIFCGWFIQMIRWSQEMDSALQVLRSYSLDPLFGNHKPHQ
ncbi:MAG: NUDIX domain-containing protein [Chloroflexi bacterium]|nr:NUDIX domain-containing protein [Chloroflexota bacterium]